MAPGQQMKILIADDQIPEDSIADEDIGEVIRKRYPTSKQSFINAFIYMRKMVNRLRDVGFNIDTCNEVSQIEESIKHNHYDLVIVDLGWGGDAHIEKTKTENEGWEIVASIQKEHSNLPIIMFSNRFLTRGDIALRAAERKVLPIYKNYDSPEFFDICITNLIAAIRFIESSKEKAFGEKLRNVDFESYKALSKITISLFLVALVFVIIGITLLFSGDIETGAITSAISIFSSVVSGLFWKYLGKLRKNITS